MVYTHIRNFSENIPSGFIKHGWLDNARMVSRKVTVFYRPWLPARHVWLPEGTPTNLMKMKKLPMTIAHPDHKSRGKPHWYPLEQLETVTWSWQEASLPTNNRDIAWEVARNCMKLYLKIGSYKPKIDNTSCVIHHISVLSGLHSTIHI